MQFLIFTKYQNIDLKPVFQTCELCPEMVIFSDDIDGFSQIH